MSTAVRVALALVTVLVLGLSAPGNAPAGPRSNAAQERPAGSSRIAFFRSAEGGDSGALWIMKPDGTGQRRLTREGDAEPDLGWSPDGRRIAFTSFRGAGSDPSVWVIRADAGGLFEVPGTRRRGGPDWSPDGRTIVLHGLLAIHPDGTNRRRLTRAGGFNPDWSPDGRLIAFDREIRSSDHTTSEIFVIGANGRGERRLTRNQVFDHDPTWSPDGRRMAFERGGYSDPGVIYVMDVNGRNVRRLGLGSTPTWSPDSRQVAFMRNFTIWIMNADGTGRRRVSPKPGRPRLSLGTHTSPDWARTP